MFCRKSRPCMCYPDIDCQMSNLDELYDGTYCGINQSEIREIICPLLMRLPLLRCPLLSISDTNRDSVSSVVVFFCFSYSFSIGSGRPWLNWFRNVRISTKFAALCWSVIEVDFAAQSMFSIFSKIFIITSFYSHNFKQILSIDHAHIRNRLFKIIWVLGLC